MGNVLNERGAADSTIRFGEWTLDTRSGFLVHGGKAVQTLRPKTTAVLAELVAASGLLVTRETLLDRVWPGITVTDDSVTQCIAEIRRALGEDGRLLRTAPRRGYVLEVPPPLSSNSAAASKPVQSTGPAVQRTPPASTARVWRIAGAAAAALTLAAVGAMAIMRSSGGQTADARQLLQQGRAVFFGPGDRSLVWQQARALFLRAHEAAPDKPEPDAWAAFTDINMVTGGFSADPAHDLADASRLADRAVLHGPAVGLAWAARASVYRLQHRPAEALDAYRRAVSLDPAQLPAKANAGWMLVLLGRPQEAVEPIRAVLEATPNSHPFRPSWHCYLGIALFHAGIGDLGAEQLRNTFTADPNDASCALAAERRLYLAAALALGGDTESARDLVAAIRSEQPGLSLDGLRKLAASDNPAYHEQREALFRGLRLAGFSDVP